MNKQTIKERTFDEFMKRFDRDKDLLNPFLVGMKMMVSSFISKDGFSRALETLNYCFGSENIIVYDQNFKVIESFKKYPLSLSKIVESHAKKYGNKDFCEEFDEVIAKKVRNIIIYNIRTERHCFYIVILDNDIIDEELKKEVIDVSKIAFYTIVDHYELVKRLKVSAQVDALTGVKNRLMYQRTTRNLSKLAPAVTFVVCDLFSLKHINDTYGHPAGDTYLKNAAKCLEKQFPKCVYKVGGDEFIIISPGKVNVDTKMVDANGELTKLMKRSIRKANEFYHVNYGHFYGKTAEISTERFYKTADANLSKDKEEMYSKLDIDRRKR